MVKNNLLRVTQMNALFFDKEISNVLWQHVQECLKYLPPGITSPFEPELRLLLKLLTVCYSVIKMDRTFGQKLLQIQYENLTVTKKILYTASCCFDYIRHRFDLWKPSHGINNTLSSIQTAVLIGNFISMSIFLKSGKKPQLIERLLNINQVYERENVQRQFDTKYMTRELLWNGLIEILIYVLPLLNYHKIKRTIRHCNPFHKKPHVSVVSNRIMTINTRCLHCGEYPVLPHHMDCAHIFCYSCLKGNQIADSRYDCPICEYSSDEKTCEPIQIAT